MSIFAALAAKWRPPPKPTFETLFRRMSSTRSSSSVSSKSWSSAASSSSSCSGTRRLEHRVNQEPNRVSSDKEVIQSYLEDAVRDSSKRTYLSFWRRYKSFCSKFCTIYGILNKKLKQLDALFKQSIVNWNNIDIINSLPCNTAK